MTGMFAANSGVNAVATSSSGSPSVTSPPLTASWIPWIAAIERLVVAAASWSLRESPL
jgi:hypothetical protein